MAGNVYGYFGRNMSWQKEIRMKIEYWLLGNSVANFLNRPYFDFLKDKIPEEFLNHEISDLGCGDGFATMKLRGLFKTKTIKGLEVNDHLIKRAKRRGLTVEKTDLEKNVPPGEMAIVWGVLHHLKNKESLLSKIRVNFKYAVFREPIKAFWAFLDGGEPLAEEEWKNLFSKTLGECKFLRFRDELFVFWKK